MSLATVIFTPPRLTTPVTVVKRCKYGYAYPPPPQVTPVSSDNELKCGSCLHGKSWILRQFTNTQLDICDHFSWWEYQSHDMQSRKPLGSMSLGPFEIYTSAFFIVSVCRVLPRRVLLSRLFPLLVAQLFSV